MTDLQLAFLFIAFCLAGALTALVIATQRPVSLDDEDFLNGQD